MIGQACEFDYSGRQALKVLRDEGYRTVLINSNPATIMTDPGWADRTYLEPLDLQGVDRGAAARAARRAAADARRPDRAQPRDGAAAVRRARRARDRADRRLGARHRDAPRTASCSPRRWRRSACASRARRSRTRSPRRARALDGGLPLPVVIRPAFTLGGHGGGFAETTEEFDAAVARGRAPRARSRRCCVEESVRGLGRVRARGDPRPPRQRRDRLLDREHRPDGRAHRRLGLRRARR